MDLRGSFSVIGYSGLYPGMGPEVVWGFR